VALVLAIEPDHRQATILKRLVREKVRADVVVVDTPDAALSAIRAQVPDVLLLSALLSPRDEDELISHLRQLDGADHLQTHTIPQLASTGAYQDDQGRKGKGLLGVFKRGKKDADAPVSGCDPELFADEILNFLQRSAEKKAQGVAALQSRVDRLEYEVQQNAANAAAASSATQSAPAAAAEAPADAGSSSSSWSSPFEWRKTPSAPAASAEERPAEPAPEPIPAYEPAPEPAPAESIFAAPEPIEATPSYAYEEARATQPPPASVLEPATPVYEDIVAAAPVAERYVEPEPVRAAPPAYERPVEETPKRSPRAKRAVNTLEPATVLRLTPLAIWARAESSAQPKNANAAPVEPKTATDELRSLIATLAVPAHVAGVSYGRGCRIRRVRVPGGKERRVDDTPGPVILSRRALEEQRSEANR
jgi:CheY-like chemotaxis protein